RRWASTNLSQFRALILANLSYFQNTSQLDRFDRNAVGLVIECCRDLLAYTETSLRETSNAQDISKDESLKRRMPPRNLLLLMTLNPMARVRLPDLRGLDKPAKRRRHVLRTRYYFR
ncbi:MAG TPA: hypothetical protein VGO47_05315, partial [Chlamydiales bacterium]|nr:hypothetical protein [Chlamydiales bacterium]